MSPSTRPQFTWLGHATVRCDLPGGEVLLIDPWLTGNPSCPVAAKDLERLDAILVTHAHSDHTGDVIPLARRFRPRVVANFEICAWLEKHGVENTSGMNLGGTQQVLDLAVTMVRADHSAASSRMACPSTAASRAAASSACPAASPSTTPATPRFSRDGADRRALSTAARLPAGRRSLHDGARHRRPSLPPARRARVIPIHWGTFPLLHGTPKRWRGASRTSASTAG